MMDGLALVRRFGKPTLLITFTCNIQWPEIQNSLYAGESAYDRPDICTRVFKQKLNLLMNYLLKKQVLGPSTYYLYTIEQQKRKCLHHAHIILGLEDTARTPDEIDNIIFAELPDPNNKRLYDAVVKHMIHGPCGALNPNSPCMKSIGDSKKKICEKNYPMEFSKETKIHENAFPEYRRRSPEDGGRQHVMERGTVLDNRWIIPYNPILLILTDSHVNVIKISSVISVKYAFKYVTKGPDRVIMKLDTGKPTNEVEQFINGRYLSASESVLKLLDISITDRSHSVQKLACHLPDEQMIYYQDGDEEEALLKGEKHTTLTAWFVANLTYEEAKGILYIDFPEHFVFKNNKWTPKLTRNKIGLNHLICLLKSSQMLF